MCPRDQGDLGSSHCGIVSGSRELALLLALRPVYGKKAAREAPQRSGRGRPQGREMSSKTLGRIATRQVMPSAVW